VSGEPLAVVERYRTIYARWQARKNYAAVGRELGVSGDRIRQICCKWERMQEAEKWRKKWGPRDNASRG
jgi:hypothetical protein